MPLIYASTTLRKGVGLYQSSDGELTFQVEVQRLAGRTSYTNGVQSRATAEEAWEDLCDYYGADLVIVDKKTLTKMLKELENG